MSDFEALLTSRERPIVTAEFPSMDGGDLATVEQALTHYRGFVDAVNITDNPAAHAHASNVSMAIAVKQLGIEPIMQVVCRDKNRIAAQADVVGASMHGVTTFCALTGDDVTAGDEPEARRVFDIDGPQLISIMSGLSRGTYLSGRELKHKKELLIGAVENPFAPPADVRIRRARMKVDAGARFLQLQIGYEPDVLESFIEGCRGNGVTERAAVMPTVILTKTAGALRFMDSNVPGIHVPQSVINRIADAENPAEESFQLVREQAEHALALAGVAGIHITDFRHDGSLERLVRELSIGPVSVETAARSA
jgi:methylenetetrahydrofolate reductase (NADPH)